MQRNPAETPKPAAKKRNQHWKFVRRAYAQVSKKYIDWTGLMAQAKKSFVSADKFMQGVRYYISIRASELDFFKNSKKKTHIVGAMQTVGDGYGVAPGDSKENASGLSSLLFLKETTPGPNKGNFKRNIDPKDLEGVDIDKWCEQGAIPTPQVSGPFYGKDLMNTSGVRKAHGQDGYDFFLPHMGKFNFQGQLLNGQGEQCPENGKLYPYTYQKSDSTRYYLGIAVRTPEGKQQKFETELLANEYLQLGVNPALLTWSNESPYGPYGSYNSYSSAESFNLGKLSQAKESIYKDIEATSFFINAHYDIEVVQERQQLPSTLRPSVIYLQYHQDLTNNFYVKYTVQTPDGKVHENIETDIPVSAQFELKVQPNARNAITIPPSKNSASAYGAKVYQHMIKRGFDLDIARTRAVARTRNELFTTMKWRGRAIAERPNMVTPHTTANGKLTDNAGDVRFVAHEHAPPAPVQVEEAILPRSNKVYPELPETKQQRAEVKIHGHQRKSLKNTSTIIKFPELSNVSHRAITEAGTRKATVGCLMEEFIGLIHTWQQDKQYHPIAVYNHHVGAGITTPLPEESFNFARGLYNLIPILVDDQLDITFYHEITDENVMNRYDYLLTKEGIKKASAEIFKINNLRKAVRLEDFTNIEFLLTHMSDETLQQYGKLEGKKLRWLARGNANITSLLDKRNNLFQEAADKTNRQKLVDFDRAIQAKDFNLIELSLDELSIEELLLNLDDSSETSNVAYKRVNDLKKLALVTPASSPRYDILAVLDDKQGEWGQWVYLDEKEAGRSGVVNADDMVFQVYVDEESGAYDPNHKNNQRIAFTEKKRLPTQAEFKHYKHPATYAAQKKLWPTLHKIGEYRGYNLPDAGLGFGLVSAAKAAREACHNQRNTYPPQPSQQLSDPWKDWVLPLVANVTDFKARDATNHVTLHHCIEDSSPTAIEILKSIVDQGASVNVLFPDGQLPWERANLKGSNGAKQCFEDHCALRYQFQLKIGKVIEAPAGEGNWSSVIADAKQTAFSRDTDMDHALGYALILAASRNEWEAVNDLLGCNIRSFNAWHFKDGDWKGWTLLHFAAAAGKLDVVTKISESSVWLLDNSKRNDFFNFQLSLACKSPLQAAENHSKMKQLLIKYGANPPQQEKKRDIIYDPKGLGRAAFQEGSNQPRASAPPPSDAYQPLRSPDPLLKSSSPKPTKPSKTWWSFFCCGCGGDALEDNDNAPKRKFSQ